MNIPTYSECRGEELYKLLENGYVLHAGWLAWNPMDVFYGFSLILTIIIHILIKYFLFIPVLCRENDCWKGMRRFGKEELLPANNPYPRETGPTPPKGSWLEGDAGLCYSTP